VNKLSINYQLEQEQGRDERFWRVIVRVDDIPLVDFAYYELAADLRELEKSAEGDGEFFILTCSCGEPRCAGIRQGIQVSHQRDRVTWVYRRPLPDPRTQPELVKQTPSRRPEWVVRGIELPTKTFVFDRTEYIAGIKQAIKRGTQLLRRQGSSEIRIVPSHNQRLLEGLGMRIGWFDNPSQSDFVGSCCRAPTCCSDKQPLASHIRVILKHKDLDLIYLGQPPIVCDKGSSPGLDRRRDLQRVGDLYTIARSQVNRLSCYFYINRQHPYLLRIEQSLLIGLRQIEPALSLREHARLDQSNDRCDALGLGLLQVPKQDLRKRQIARMPLPQVDKGSTIDTHDIVSFQILL